MVKMVNIKVTLNDDVVTYKAIRERNKIIYKEPLYTVTVDYSDDLKIIKENEEYLLTLYFKNNEKTKGSCLLNQENVSMNMDILTDYVVKEDNFISVKYKVLTTGKENIYKLEV